MLHSSDSMAWSYGERMAGRNANDWRAATAYVEMVKDIKTGQWQSEFPLSGVDPSQRA